LAMMLMIYRPKKWRLISKIRLKHYFDQGRKHRFQAVNFAILAAYLSG
jgi:hypothetical protein